MMIEKNEYYLTEKGEIITSVFINNYQSKSAIAHIPKDLHLFLLQSINDYYIDEYFRETIKSVWS